MRKALVCTRLQQVSGVGEGRLRAGECIHIAMATPPSSSFFFLGLFPFDTSNISRERAKRVYIYGMNETGVLHTDTVSIFSTSHIAEVRTRALESSRVCTSNCETYLSLETQSNISESRVLYIEESAETNSVTNPPPTPEIVWENKKRNQSEEREREKARL